MVLVEFNFDCNKQSRYFFSRERELHSFSQSDMISNAFASTTTTTATSESKKRSEEDRS